MAAMSLVFDILANDKASKEFNAVGDASDKVAEKGSKIGKLMGGGLLVAGAAIGEFGKKAFEAAADGEKAHAALVQAVKNTGGSMEELEPKVDALSSRFAKFGFTNDEVEKALASMTTSLRDPKKAMDAMGLAADLAKYKHVSLADASIVVAKAMEGQLRPLKQLGIDLPVAAGGALKLEHAHDAVAKAQEKVNDVLAKYPDALQKTSKGHEKYLNAVQGVTAAQDKLSAVQDAAGAITKGLADAVGGQASAAADTYAGKLAAMHAQFENLTEKVGNQLMPIITTLVTKLSEMADYFDRNSAVLGPLVGIVAGLAGVIIAIIEAQKAWTAVQAAFNIVMSANPIGLVIIAIAALVVGIVEAYKHSQTFRDIVTDAFDKVKVAAQAVAGFFTKDIPAAFNSVKNAASSVMDWLKEHWALILAILTGPFGLAVLAIATHWGAIKQGASEVVTWIKDKFNGVVSFFTGLPARLGSAFAGAFDGLKNAFRSAVNIIINGWNRLHFKLPSFDTHIPGVGKVGGFDIGMPHIPELAAGGIIPATPGGRIVRVGEGRSDEAVIPLSGGHLRLHRGDLDYLADRFVAGVTGIGAAADLRAAGRP